jgi:hypothetical protein
MSPPAGSLGSGAGAEAAVPTNGSLAPVPSQPPADRPREVSEQPPAREYHAEPRESVPAHEAAPLAHFEPAPKPDAAAAGPGKPYVVWSSAPSTDAGPRGTEE